MLLKLLELVLFLGFSITLYCQSEEDTLIYTKYYYENGNVSSEGYLRKGRPDGYWKSYYRNKKLKSEGNRKNFELERLWFFYNEDGDKIVEISYSGDQKNGFRKTFEDGQIIKEDHFVNNELQGFTRNYYFTGELKSELPFVDGNLIGMGYEYEKDGRITTLITYRAGILAKQRSINQKDKIEQKQGVWVEFYPNRVIKLEGTYVNDLKNGYWKYYRSDGSLIKVEKWIMGVLHQNAREVAKVEIIREINPNTGKLDFKGAYRNGKPDGVHRKYDEDGNVIESKIYDNGIVLFEGIIDEKGRKQDLWKEYYRTGELKTKGSYRDNLKVGNWVYYYINGEIEQKGDYLKGLANDIWTWFHNNGQIWREEEYLFGKEHGSSVEYNDIGVLVAKGDYVGGLKDGKWFYQVNDHSEIGNYFEGQRIGFWKYYYADNGQLRFEGSYENGLEMGIHLYYYHNDQIERRGNYTLGEKDGIWEYFTETGEHIITIQYEDGKEIKYNGKHIRLW